eukprot:Plantae.Rhodophyta-Purpureofilum_apyrenoidigerum.ctg8124.p2 GENE.Plantae.Rhodophyta-Purpureofilum_apyrenoidigerum.ctg8124~~Plantae.Rhodophyta-Purpureofilum_apyrenoidigerum.ctg8124.p2  ORF type:complete len:110 (-),score=22.52 Plantae.Rhodophyta-Purpureofilum_apyrenoidigerum.ctg8124:331-660(-)
MTNVLQDAFGAYQQKIPLKLKVIDVYLLYTLLTGIVQLLFVVLVGRFPFNSFLAGFISNVGCFILTVSLRMHTNAENKSNWPAESTQRAFADWLFANLILHLAVLNFLG